MTLKEKYILRKDVIHTVPIVEITPTEFEVLKRSSSTLHAAFEIEETYEIMITNYIDLERQALDTSVTYMVRIPQDYSDFFFERVALNTRYINLLTATKMYVDQIPRIARDCIGGTKTELAEFKKIFLAAKNEVKEFRFIEELRNHVQHYGLPVHSMMLDSSWTSLGGNGLMEHSTRVFCLRKSFERDTRFDKSVLNECEEKIDLLYNIRRYIETLSEINCKIRERIETTVNDARRCIEDKMKRYSKVYSDSLLGLCAKKFQDDAEVEKVSLTLEWDNIRQKLQKRNLRIVNLRKRFVSSSTKCESIRNGG